jgi:acyl-CoA hydrolase
MQNRCEIIMSQVMMPHQANPAGNVHGGEIMKLMDIAAGAVAIKYSRSNCVTARVDELEFHLPILVGALVCCRARIVYTGKSSMEVLVTVESEDLETERGPQKALSAYFTMVALDKTGRPNPVPSYTAGTEEKKQLHEEAARRVEQYKLRKQNRGSCA